MVSNQTKGLPGTCMNLLYAFGSDTSVSHSIDTDLDIDLGITNIVSDLKVENNFFSANQPTSSSSLWSSSDPADMLASLSYVSSPSSMSSVNSLNSLNSFSSFNSFSSSVDTLHHSPPPPLCDGGVEDGLKGYMGMNTSAGQATFAKLSLGAHTRAFPSFVTSSSRCYHTCAVLLQGGNEEEEGKQKNAAVLERAEIKDAVATPFPYFEYTGENLPKGVVKRITRMVEGKEGKEEEEVVCDFMLVPPIIQLFDEKAKDRYEASTVTMDDKKTIPYFYREDYFKLFNKAFRRDKIWILGGKGIGKSYAFLRLYWDMKSGDEGWYTYTGGGNPFQFKFGGEKTNIEAEDSRNPPLLDRHRYPVFYLPTTILKPSEIIYAIHDAINQWFVLNEGKEGEEEEREEMTTVRDGLQALAKHWKLNDVLPLLQEGNEKSTNKLGEIIKKYRDESTKNFLMHGSEEILYDLFKLKEDDPDVGMLLLRLTRNLFSMQIYVIFDQLFTGFETPEEKKAFYKEVTRIFASNRVIFGVSYNAMHNSSYPIPNDQAKYMWHSFSQPLTAERALDMFYFQYCHNNNKEEDDSNRALVQQFYEAYKEREMKEEKGERGIWKLIEYTTGFVPMNLATLFKKVKDSNTPIFSVKVTNACDAMREEEDRNILQQFDGSKDKEEFIQSVFKMAALDEKLPVYIPGTHMNFRYVTVGEFLPTSLHRVRLLCGMYKDILDDFIKTRIDVSGQYEDIVKRIQKVIGSDRGRAYEKFIRKLTYYLSISPPLYRIQDGETTFDTNQPMDIGAIELSANRRCNIDSTMFNNGKLSDIPTDGQWYIRTQTNEFNMPACEFILERKHTDDEKSSDYILVQTTITNPKKHATRGSPEAQILTMSKPIMQSLIEKRKELADTEADDKTKIKKLEEEIEELENNDFATKFKSLFSNSKPNSVGFLYITLLTENDQDRHLNITITKPRPNFDATVYRQDVCQYLGHLAINIENYEYFALDEFIRRHKLFYSNNTPSSSSSSSSDKEGR